MNQTLKQQLKMALHERDVNLKRAKEAEKSSKRKDSTIKNLREKLSNFETKDKMRDIIDFKPEIIDAINYLSENLNETKKFISSFGCGKSYIEITADTNDGDYVTELTEISNKTLEKIMPIIKDIKEKETYNTGIFAVGGTTADQMYAHHRNFRQFERLVPSGECGVHTIVGIKVFDVSSINKLV